MPVELVLRLGIFDDPADAALARRAIERLLGALTANARDFLLAHPETPRLYRSGVRYDWARVGLTFQDVPSLLHEKFGACQDFGPWRAAELQLYGDPTMGLPPMPNAVPDHFWTRRLNGQPLIHVPVRLDNATEDPSKRLGM